jgi:hypothetical protein
MDKTLKFEKAILDFLADFAPIVPYGWDNVRNQIMADKEQKHYQLVRIGWQDGKRIHYVVFHFDIIGNKIWVQQNRTDLPIVEELEEFGIESDDIVLGFWKPDAMKYEKALA